MWHTQQHFGNEWNVNWKKWHILRRQRASSQKQMFTWAGQQLFCKQYDFQNDSRTQTAHMRKGCRQTITNVFRNIISSMPKCWLWISYVQQHLAKRHKPIGMLKLLIRLHGKFWLIAQSNRWFAIWISDALSMEILHAEKKRERKKRMPKAMNENDRFVLARWNSLIFQFFDVLWRRAERRECNWGLHFQQLVYLSMHMITCYDNIAFCCDKRCHKLSNISICCK